MPIVAEIPVEAKAAPKATDSVFRFYHWARTVAALDTVEVEGPQGRQKVKITPTVRNVAWALASHANSKTGLCNPKQQTLAREICAGSRTIERSIEVLHKIGALKPSYGRGYRATYELLIDFLDHPAPSQEADLSEISSADLAPSQKADLSISTKGKGETAIAVSPASNSREGSRGSDASRARKHKTKVERHNDDNAKDRRNERRSPSPKQIEFILDLCADLAIDPPNLDTLDRGTAWRLIKDLKAQRNDVNKVNTDQMRKDDPIAFADRWRKYYNETEGQMPIGLTTAADPDAEIPF